MNIAVINAKDLFKYILKFLVIVSITFFMIKLLKTVDLKKQEDSIKENKILSKESFLRKRESVGSSLHFIFLEIQNNNRENTC